MTEQLEKAQKGIQLARGTLFFIGGVTAIFGFYFLYSGDSLFGLDGSILFDACIMLILGAISFRYPLVAFSIGLVLYVLGQVSIVMQNPEAFTKNLIMKGYIIYALVMGIKAAYEIKSMQNDVDMISQIDTIGDEKDTTNTL